MSFFKPNEKQLVINPITSSPIIGKNVDNYEGVLTSMRKKLKTDIDLYFNRIKSYEKHKRKSAKRCEDGIFTIIKGCGSQALFYQQNRFSKDDIDFSLPYDNKRSSKMSESFDCSQRGLSIKDIDGASPERFRKMKRRKVFVDKNEIKSIFGEKPGRYHGYKNDLNSGGTYNDEPQNKKLVEDITKYTRKKFSLNKNYRFHQNSKQNNKNNFDDIFKHKYTYDQIKNASETEEDSNNIYKICNNNEDETGDWTKGSTKVVVIVLMKGRLFECQLSIHQKKRTTNGAIIKAKQISALGEKEKIFAKNQKCLLNPLKLNDSVDSLNRNCIAKENNRYECRSTKSTNTTPITLNKSSSNSNERLLDLKPKNILSNLKLKNELKSFSISHEPEINKVIRKELSTCSFPYAF